MTQQMIDVLPFEYKILEDDRENGRMIVRGIFQREGVKNENGRIYPRGLFEKKLQEKAIRDKIRNRGMFGELDHPPDGKTSLSRVSHLITRVWTDKNGIVYGEAEILDTPRGKVLQELFRANTRVGISSRGSGTLGKNEPIVQDDYRLETWDFVANPSTPGAYPEIISESVETKYTVEDAVQKLDEIKKYLMKVQGKMSSARQDELVEFITNMNLYEKHLKAIRLLEDADIKEVSRILVEVLDGLRKQIGPRIDYEHSHKIEGGFAMTQDNVAKDLQNAEILENLELIQEQLDSMREGNTSNNLLEEKYAVAVAIIEEMKNRFYELSDVVDEYEDEIDAAGALIESLVDRINSKSSAINDDLYSMNDAAEDLLQSLLERYEQVNSDYSDLAEKFDASVALLEAVISQTWDDQLESFIEASLEDHPYADTIRPLIESSESLEEARERMRIVDALTESMSDGYDGSFDYEPLPGGGGPVRLDEEDDSYYSGALFDDAVMELNEGVQVARKVTKRLRWR